MGKKRAEIHTARVLEADADSAVLIDDQSPLSPPAQVYQPHEQEPAPLLVYNLLNDLETLGSLLLDEVRRASWLNAYLLAAGMNQIVEDYLHPDPYFLGKASGHLARLGLPAANLTAGTTRAIAASIARLRGLQSRARYLSNWQVEFADFLQRLADIVACPTSSTSIPREALFTSVKALLEPLRDFPRPLLRDVLRLPSCFQSFDQQPVDLDSVARKFAQRRPDRHRPLLIVGVRSSGSYLAPLYGAFFKVHGFLEVQVLTLRPGRWLWRRERDLLKSTVRRRGLVLITDDPPVSGDSLVEAAEALERAGAPSQSIIMLLQLFASSRVLPPGLQRYESVRLPWEEWAVHGQLGPEAVQAELAELLAPARVVSTVKRLPLPPPRWERSHTHALYQVGIVEQAGGRRYEQLIYAKGVGLGYFGEHALAIGRALESFLPEVYGVGAGLMYRAWLPESQRFAPQERGNELGWAKELSTYVRARHHALGVKEDVSLRLVGRLPVWEAAANLLSQAFGRGWMIARLPIADPIIKSLLRCTEPSVIDGNMTPSHWFTKEGDGHRLLKVGFAERAFSNRDLSCYDPVFDVAAMAASLDMATTAASDQEQRLPHLMRAEYENLSMESISPERWLFYQLVHLRSLRHIPNGERPEVRRALSRALQRYYTEIFFNDVQAPVFGEICALDIDGVLESSPLGFSGLTPAGAVTLRALTLHGYRPILATGRSLDEIRERCSAYHLAGGVAEYGSVVYNHGTGEVLELLSDRDRHDLDRLRASLADIPGVLLDLDYCRAVRAYRLDAAGRRRGIDPEPAAAALNAAEVSHRVRPIAGQAQTDFMVGTIDKSTGLRALVAQLDSDGRGNPDKPLALAVGDTVSDLPMFDLAAMAFAPANADAVVRCSDVTVLRRPYQSGLAMAAGRLLGHAPGSCPQCQSAPLSRDTRFLLDILAAQEAGTWSIARRALLLGADVWNMKHIKHEDLG